VLLRDLGVFGGRHRASITPRHRVRLRG
jgi:hypothetical protein